MNDEDLMTLVREQRSGVPMTTPLDQIISRGRSVRARRRLPGVAGALAAAASVAVATVALVPSGNPAARQEARLTAWTVTKAHGNVTVTLRELRDPARLQAAMRADGVPAYIAFAGPVPARCQVYQASQATLHAIYQIHQGNGTAHIVIDPAAIPRGAGLFMMKMPAKYAEGQPPPYGVAGGQGFRIGVVYASKSCPLT